MLSCNVVGHHILFYTAYPYTLKAEAICSSKSLEHLPHCLVHIPEDQKNNFISSYLSHHTFMLSVSVHYLQKQRHTLRYSVLRNSAVTSTGNNSHLMCMQETSEQLRDDFSLTPVVRWTVSTTTIRQSIQYKAQAHVKLPFNL
jgi:hypothetical protein